MTAVLVSAALVAAAKYLPNLAIAIGVLLLILFALFLLTGAGVWILATAQGIVARFATTVCYRLGLLAALRLVVGRRLVGQELNRTALRLIESHDYDSAINVLSAAIHIDFTEVSYWVNRGVANRQADRIDAAIGDLSHAIEINPMIEHAREHRGFAYFAKGMFREARADLADYPCSDRSHALVAHWRGLAHEKLLEWEDAAQDYEKAYELDNSLTDAVLALARLQAGCPKDSVRNGQKAIENARRICIQTNWDDWTSLSILAAAYAEVGDFQSAVRFARQAADSAPESEQETRVLRIRQYEASSPFRIEHENRDCAQDRQRVGFA
jgi:tetratricopeptide (TPR) repeat protein